MVKMRQMKGPSGQAWNIYLFSSAKKVLLEIRKHFMKWKKEAQSIHYIYVTRGNDFNPSSQPIASSTGTQMLSMKERMKTGDSFKHLLGIKQKDCVKAQTPCFLPKSWTPKLQWLMKWQPEKGRVCSMLRWMKAACTTGSSATEI